ncbi:MAG: metallophosphoesterase [Planctomycetaceae bacterium]|nr:metallophosphoesterase [Planctomycetaceae bacterium]
MHECFRCGLPLAVVLLVFAIYPAFAEDSAEKQLAKGVVFLDKNEDGKLNDADKRLPGIKVSNGRDIATTNSDGGYELSVDDDDIIFVIKPRGMRTPLSKNKLPRFYYIHKPKGSPDLRFAGVKPTGDLPESINFPLYKQDEPEQFRAIMFGDPQARDTKEVDYIKRDVVEELIGTDASFGVTLGDIVFDDLNVFEPLKQTIAMIGIPWYNVVGNHDINLDAKHDHHSDETFERMFGPSYYSFDHGQVHFLVIDNIEWFVPDGAEKGKYRGGLGGDQLRFIKNDLTMIPEDQMVVLMMHIPLNDLHNQRDLYRLIEKRPFCISISGHTHTHEHRFITKKDGWEGPEPHHHIVNVTVSGSWWSGKPDDRGIPHTIMRDGAPNGYSILSFDGTKYKLDFKAAGFATDYQMNIHAPDTVAIADLAETTVYANVFNGSERSEVEMRIGDSGDWVAMEQTRAVDPNYKAIFDAEAAALAKKAEWRKLSNPHPSSHLWKAPLPAQLPAGTHIIRVRTKDPHGREYSGERKVAVK